MKIPRWLPPLSVAAACVLGWTGAFRGQTAAPPTLAKDVQPIFDGNCIKCHGPKEQRAHLDLSAGKSFAMIVGVPSVQVDTLVRVKPGDPENSYLMQKIRHTAAQGRGMPRGFFGSSWLSDREIETIRAWIANGAKP